MTQNGPKMALNGIKCLGKWSKWGEEYQHQTSWPKMVEICQKIPKNGQNDPKMAKNDPKWPKMAQKWPKMVLNV